MNRSRSVIELHAKVRAANYVSSKPIFANPILFCGWQPCDREDFRISPNTLDANDIAVSQKP